MEFQGTPERESLAELVELAAPRIACAALAKPLKKETKKEKGRRKRKE